MHVGKCISSCSINVTALLRVCERTRGRDAWSKFSSIHSHIARFTEDETFGVSLLGEAFRHNHPVYSMVMGLQDPICLKTS